MTPTTAAPLAPEAVAAPVRVLLIEDNDLDAFLLGEMLRQHPGMEASVERAGDLADGLDRLHRGGIDLVLLDLSLPDSRDLETYRTVESAALGVPVIVCSASDDAALGIEAVRMGAQDYLVKGQITPDTLARSVRYSLERHRMLAALRGLSLVDELTGLYNRRGFVTLAQGHVSQASRAHRRFVLVMADLDGLKPINDTFGHKAGDAAIRIAAEVLRNSFRSSDVVARMGGDEFAVLALETSESGESVMMYRITEGLAAVNASEEFPFAVSLSIGSVPFTVDANVRLEEIMERADMLLYEEKRRKGSLRLSLIE